MGDAVFGARLTPTTRNIRVAFRSTRVLRGQVRVREFPGRLLPVQVGDDPPGPAVRR